MMKQRNLSHMYQSSLQLSDSNIEDENQSGSLCLSKTAVTRRLAVVGYEFHEFKVIFFFLCT